MKEQKFIQKLVSKQTRPMDSYGDEKHHQHVDVSLTLSVTKSRSGMSDGHGDGSLKASSPEEFFTEAVLRDTRGRGYAGKQNRPQSQNSATQNDARSH